MKAITYSHYGSPDVLEFSEIQIPQPGKQEVLIRVHAASCNPYDWHFLRGAPGFVRLFTGLGRPKNPRLGADVSGTVELVGQAVTQFKPGDPVFGTCKGSFAEYACANPSSLARKPDSLSHSRAAALPIAAITALQALRDVAAVKPGQTVLINGAAGGVGTFAVQIARWLGARVTGVCSTRNMELVRSLGAERVIDYTCRDFTIPAFPDHAEHYDVLFDLIANRTLAELRRILTPRGIFIGCGGGGPDTPSAHLIGRMLGQTLLSPFVSQKLTGILARVNSADLEILAALVQSETITPIIDRTYPLSRTAEAMRYLELGHARGKVIISIA
jgi:NADPH:quinone reductase-like Zn-dependent oxidoreductase